MPTSRRFESGFAAHIGARPSAPPTQTGTAGTFDLQLRSKGRALLHVSQAAVESGNAALAVMLHGAGGNAGHGLDLLRPYADDANLIVLAPESRKASWDIIADAQYGPDVRLIEECLEHVFASYSVAPSRIAIGGFSDGASYALSLGLSNGLLFPQILAFSPGFMAPVRYEGIPGIFMSHGTRDEILPIDSCSRKLLGVLRRRGFAVDYYEFDGPHTVPTHVRERAVQILLAGSSGGEKNAGIA